ncbi:hypothetical protein SCP_1203470 [Sparassis crispa]|uniref:Uncharacterized protein n=1 Tax=Sparassis crispa TaxID=139825 RepID=A0A401H110_9APHY|nr:hypothetical protein SCP_1203470 [Sparassis crispa]GBE88117.1 hypothetical protein SCP_1203470 [Sparassis crispa]
MRANEQQAGERLQPEMVIVDGVPPGPFNITVGVGNELGERRTRGKDIDGQALLLHACYATALPGEYSNQCTWFCFDE